MRRLIAFYQHRLPLFSKGDDWCQVLKAYLLKHDLDEAFTSHLLGEVEASSINDPNDYLYSLRKLVSLSFLNRLKPTLISNTALQRSYRNLYTHGFCKEFQLGEALYALGCSLVGLPMPKLDPKQLPKGGVLVESGNHLSDKSIPHPLLNAELALVWLFLGWSTDSDCLIQAALKWVHVTMGIFDHENRPFHGFWLRESEYDPLLFLTLYYLLFSASSKALISSKIQHLSDALFRSLEEIHESSFKKLPVFLIFLALGFENLVGCKKKLETDCCFSINESDPSLGYLSFKQNDISLACSFSGVNTGIGALHKTHIQIASFGPHFAPLSDSSYYGLNRSVSGLGESFPDLELEKGEDRFKIRGWSRTASPKSSNQLGSQWIYFSALGNEENIIFESRLFEKDVKCSLYFVYFIIADLAHIKGEQALKPATLDRYQGFTQPLIFEKKGQTLSFDPKFDGKMSVIPLAGSHHFWGADFLLAFPFEERQEPFLWEIK